MKKAYFYNFVLFQFGWWMCVCWGQSKVSTSIWIASMALVIGLHFFIVVKDSWKQQALYIVLLSITGILMDYVMVKLNVFSASEKLFYGLPIWLIGMWLLFPMLVPNSLSWMKGRTFLQVIFGAIGGYITYFSGEALKVLSLDENHFVLLFAWAVFFPCSFLIYDLICKLSYFDKSLRT